MLQTLFVIPHWVFEGPLLVAWLVIGALVLGWLFWKHGNSSDTWSFLPLYLIVAGVIHFVLPRVEITDLDPADPLGPMVKSGLAIRGYGVFLLLAIVTGVVLAIRRCQRIGVEPDQILQLGFWMIVSGVVGARLFYVVQKADSFSMQTLSWQTMIDMVDMTKGGLVVYGSLVGGMIGAAAFLIIRRLPALQVGDLIAPAMAIGLAIGRLGCLMNGCCYGGVCESELPGIAFPAGSPPYMQQLVNGDLLGVKSIPVTDPEIPFQRLLEWVERGSIADRLGLSEGDQISIQPPSSDVLRFHQQYPDQQDVATLPVQIYSQQQGVLSFPLRDLPARSRPAHPTQIYSAINALLLCLVLWFFWTMPHRDGQVFALMLILYAIARFLLELIRQDEAGQFGTSFTISQWVSMIMLILGFSLWAFASFRPAANDQATVKV